MKRTNSLPILVCLGICLVILFSVLARKKEIHEKVALDVQKKTESFFLGKRNPSNFGEIASVKHTYENTKETLKAKSTAINKGAKFYPRPALNAPYISEPSQIHPSLYPDPQAKIDRLLKKNTPSTGPAYIGPYSTDASTVDDGKSKPNKIPSIDSNLKETEPEEFAIAGEVKPLLGLITSKKEYSNFYAYAQDNCLDPKVGLYYTKDILKLAQTPLMEQPLNPDTKFFFELDETIDRTKPNDYALQITGCDTYLARIITGFTKNQNIQLSSTLLSYTQVSSIGTKVDQVAASEFSKLSQQLEKKEMLYTSVNDVYQELDANLSTSFSHLFNGALPQSLETSLPVIREITLPSLFSEGVPEILSVDAYHWHPTYDLSAEWIINGVSKGFGTNWTWTPSANSKANVNIEVRIGQKKSSENTVDTSLPYHKVTFSRPVLNTILPLSPVLASEAIVNSPVISLRMTTGVLIDGEYDFCSSFSKLAITESPISPDSDQFNYICSQEFSQDFTYPLTALNRDDGYKNLYLWARDDLGEISSSPSTVSFYLDQTAPYIVIDPLASVHGGGNQVVINWGLTENSITISNEFTLDFFDGTTWSQIETLHSAEGPLTNEPFSTVFTLPYSNISNARFRIGLTDLAGNSSIELSNSFSVKVPEIISSPLSHNFGKVISQTTSVPQTITFTNIGGWKTAGCGLPILTGDSGEFAIVSENCSLIALEKDNGSCEVVVMGTPKTKSSFSADLILTCGSKSASSSLLIQGDNNPPTIASSQSYSLNEDVILNFTADSGSDLDNDPLTYSIVTPPSHGIVSGCMINNAVLTCSYNPNLNYNGTDSFTYRANDGENNSNIAIVNLTINPVNDAPTLSAGQTIETDEDTDLNFELDMGSDIDGDVLTYLIVNQPTSGNLVCTGGTSRACVYSPNSDFFGSDSFTYKVNDGVLDSSVVTVSINVKPTNDHPIAGSDFSISTDEDTLVNFNLVPGTDIDNPTGDLTYTLVTGPSHGILSKCLQGTSSSELNCDYQPDLNYYGSDSFIYKVCDLTSCSVGVTNVSLTVNPINDPPVMISNQTFNLSDNEIVEFTLSGASDVDIPTQSLSYKITTPLANGLLEGCIDSLAWKTSKACKFTPPVNFNGELSFTYKAFDSEDESLNESTITFNIVDKTASPKPVIALHSPYYTNDVQVQVTNTNCNDIEGLYISTSSAVPEADDINWTTCSTLPGALTTFLPAQNSLHSLYVWSKDSFQNINSLPATISVVYDDIAPVINLFSHNVEGNKNAVLKFTLTETNSSSSQNFNIEFFNGSTWSSWTESSSAGPLVNKSFSTSVPAPNLDDAELTLKITYEDLAGNSATVSRQFKTDLTPPSISLLSVNNDQPVANNNNVLIKLQANDDKSPINSFCLKYNENTKPLKDDECWRDVSATPPGISPSLNIDFANYFFQIGFVKTTYDIFVWVKNEAEMISNNSGALGIDHAEIYFDPGTPPRITNIEATNSNTPNIPVNSADLIAMNGQDIFIRWFAEDDEGMEERPISIEYTLNDTTFDAFPNGTGLNLLNGMNGSCTFGPEFTGCAVLKAPTSDYFKVRVVAKDSVETTVFINPSPFNDTKLTILAGNTEHGLNGSALTAVFYAYGSSKTNSFTYKYNMVMSDDGKFFYLDLSRGLLWVDPQTGALTEFMKETGTGTGENVHISSATLRNPLAITLDAKNNLLIWDTDSIREVNLSTYKIRTLFGKGTLATTTTTIPAANFKLATSISKRYESLIPLPNGDIIFTSPYSSLTQYRFKAATNEIEPMVLAGQGVSGYESDSWSSLSVAELALAYNPSTSAIEFLAKSFVKSFTGDSYPLFAKLDPLSGNATTPYQTMPPHNLAAMRAGNTQTGLDGKLYFVDRFRKNIFQYNHETNALVNILGTGGTAANPCSDGTLSTSCPVDIDSYFVNKTGRVYFLDNGVVRTIDDSKKVITLFGQFPSFGNGSLATLARFGNIVDISLDKHTGDFDKLIIQDGLSNEFRQFTISSTIDRLATYSFTSTGPYRFEVDKSTGDIFSSSGAGLIQFERALDTWKTVVGGGSTVYSDPSADGKTGSQIKYPSSYPRTITGLENNKLIYYRNSWSSGYYACMTKFYDTLLNFKQEHFIGDGTCTAKYSENNPLGNMVFETSNIKSFTDPVTSTQKYFFTRIGANRMYKATPGGNLELFTLLAHNIRSYTFKDTDGLQFFYCNGGKLYQYDYLTNTTAHLTWNSPTITCKINYQQTPLYVPTRNSVIFVFTQNGLDGVAEYKLP